jgi:hypothetical protein
VSLVLVLVILQYAIVSSGDFSFLDKIFDDNKKENIVQNSVVVEDTKAKDSIQEEKTITKKIDINSTKIEDKKVEIIVKKEEPKEAIQKPKMVEIKEPKEIVIDINKTKEAVVKKEKIKEEIATKGKIITLAKSLIRSTPVLDRTKANAVDFEEKNIVLEYEKELKYWYYLGNNRYIHKSVVKKIK